MRIAELETFLVNVKYTTPEVSTITSRVGITQTIVKLITDDGIVGWGESPRTADAVHIEAAIGAMRPLVVGRDPWDTEAIARDVDRLGMWNFQPMTRNIAFSGIDMALWDICGKACGQPLYKLFGGAQRESVDYFYYVNSHSLMEIEQLAREGVERGYTVFYIKAGLDAAAEEEQLRVLRSVIGSERKIRIDCNMAWSPAEAVRLLNRWDDMFDLDFVEAPVRIEPLDLSRDVKRKTRVPICVNEGLWREQDVIRVIQSRTADVLCFCSYWVGSLQRFATLARYAHLEGISVCKHTPGELGLMAAAAQHMMVALPNVIDGNQQTAQLMQGDLLAREIPIATGPSWGRIEGPGLGVEVDEAKLRARHEAFLHDGAYPPYGER
jgi:glucarate dehydratase